MWASQPMQAGGKCGQRHDNECNQNSGVSFSYFTIGDGKSCGDEKRNQYHNPIQTKERMDNTECPLGDPFVWDERFSIHCVGKDISSGNRPVLCDVVPYRNVAPKIAVCIQEHMALDEDGKKQGNEKSVLNTWEEIGDCGLAGEA